MNYIIGDRVRPTPAAMQRDRNLPSHDCAKRTLQMTGTVVATKINVRGNIEYKVRWDTPGQPFSYYPRWQSPNMIQPY